jgi:7,8-dihydroneopterin aldolase/epimerase/oxygenase
MGLIKINGIKLYAYHGCLDEEAQIGGNYIVDVDITADLSEAVRSDSLKNTVDYCQVYDIVKREMAIRSKLIEHVAGRILHALKKEITSINHVTVTVEKISPPVGGEMGSAAVVVEI